MKSLSVGRSWPEGNKDPDLSEMNGRRNDDRHIVAIVPRGEVIRNFVHSGCFEQIAEEASLSILSVDTGVDFASLDRGPEVAMHSLVPLRERWPVRFQREILDISHGRWLWSEAAKERWRIRDLEARSFREKAIRLTKKSLAIPFANNIGLKLLSRSERLTSRMLNPSDQYAELYRSIRPSLVFNGSHIHSAIATPAVQTAQWMGIPTATFIFSWDNLTSQGRITLPYDYFLVWNEGLKEQLLEMYPWIEEKSVFVTGSPQFDFHFRPEFYWTREHFCSEIGADVKRPIILYSTGMANHMPGETEIVESIADHLLEYDADERPQLLVRVYAKDLTGRFDDMRVRRKDIFFQKVLWDPAWLTPEHDDSYSLVNALRHCSVGINIASTVSLELCMFDKPVINVGYDDDRGNDLGMTNSLFYSFEHYRPVVDSGAVQVAWSFEEMKTLLFETLNYPEARQQERKRLISQMFGEMLDGNSAERISRALLKIAGHERSVN